ncbi:hypothetical protein [Shinella zoogloeoides]|uniref:hypothetical protein n=1 Tax=Shinella zoogloeoides TaxID=352475 RepID=UPI0028AF338A|nr:hypothetical protein [Shinella zoogloeoides]
MTVHYDVEKTLADLRKSLGSSALPPSAPPATKICERSVELHLGFVRMALEEENRGMDRVDIVLAGAMAYASFCANVLDITPPPVRDAARLLILSRLNRYLDECLSGHRQAFAQATVTKERGGHA